MSEPTIEQYLLSVGADVSGVQEFLNALAELPDALDQLSAFINGTPLVDVAAFANQGRAGVRAFFQAMQAEMAGYDIGSVGGFALARLGITPQDLGGMQAYTAAIRDLNQAAREAQSTGVRAATPQYDQGTILGLRGIASSADAVGTRVQRINEGLALMQTQLSNLRGVAIPQNLFQRNAQGGYQLSDRAERYAARTVQETGNTNIANRLLSLRPDPGANNLAEVNRRAAAQAADIRDDEIRRITAERSAQRDLLSRVQAAPPVTTSATPIVNVEAPPAPNVNVNVNVAPPNVNVNVEPQSRRGRDFDAEPTRPTQPPTPAAPAASAARAPEPARERPSTAEAQRNVAAAEQATASAANEASRELRGLDAAINQLGSGRTHRRVAGAIEPTRAVQDAYQQLGLSRDQIPEAVVRNGRVNTEASRQAVLDDLNARRNASSNTRETANVDRLTQAHQNLTNQLGEETRQADRARALGGAQRPAGGAPLPPSAGGGAAGGAGGGYRMSGAGGGFGGGGFPPPPPPPATPNLPVPYRPINTDLVSQRPRRMREGEGLDGFYLGGRAGSVNPEDAQWRRRYEEEYGRRSRDQYRRRPSDDIPQDFRRPEQQSGGFLSRSLGDFRRGYTRENDQRPQLEQLGASARIATTYGGLYTAISLVQQGFTAVAQDTLQYTDALNNLNIITGRTTAQNETFAQTLGNLSTAAGLTSAEGVRGGAQAIGLFGVAGADQQTQERVATTSVDIAAKVAALGGAPFEDVQTQMAGLARSLGGGAESLPGIFDSLSVVARQTGRSVADLVPAAADVGTLAAGAGFDQNQLFAAIGRISSTTGQTPQGAASSFRQVLSRADDPNFQRRVEQEFGIRAVGRSLSEIFADFNQRGGAGGRAPNTQEINQFSLLFGRGASQQVAQILARDFTQVNALAQQAGAPENRGVGDKLFADAQRAFGAQVRLLAQELLNLGTQLARSGVLDILYPLVQVLRGVVAAASGVVTLFSTLTGAFDTLIPHGHSVVYMLAEIYGIARLLGGRFASMQAFTQGIDNFFKRIYANLNRPVSETARAAGRNIADFGRPRSGPGENLPVPYTGGGATPSAPTPPPPSGGGGRGPQEPIDIVTRPMRTTQTATDVTATAADTAATAAHTRAMGADTSATTTAAANEARASAELTAAEQRAAIEANAAGAASARLALAAGAAATALTGLTVAAGRQALGGALPGGPRALPPGAGIPGGGDYYTDASGARRVRPRPGDIAGEVMDDLPGGPGRAARAGQWTRNAAGRLFSGGAGRLGGVFRGATALGGGALNALGLGFMANPIGLGLAGAGLGAYGFYRANQARNATSEATQGLAGQFGAAKTSDDLRKVANDARAAAEQARQEMDFTWKSSDSATLGLSTLVNLLPGSGARRDRANAETTADQAQRAADAQTKAEDEARRNSPAFAFGDFTSADNVSAALQDLSDRGYDAAYQLDQVSSAFNTMVQAASQGARAVIPKGGGDVFAGKLAQGIDAGAADGIGALNDLATSLDPTGRDKGNKVTGIIGGLMYLPFSGIGQSDFTDTATQIFGTDGSHAESQRAADVAKELADPNKFNQENLRKNISQKALDHLRATGRDPATASQFLTGDDETKFNEIAQQELDASLGPIKDALLALGPKGQEVYDGMLVRARTSIKTTLDELGGNGKINPEATKQFLTQEFDLAKRKAEDVLADTGDPLKAVNGGVKDSRAALDQARAGMEAARKNGASDEELATMQRYIDLFDRDLNTQIEEQTQQRVRRAQAVAALGASKLTLDDVRGRSAFQRTALEKQLDLTRDPTERKQIQAQLNEQALQDEQQKLADSAANDLAAISPQNNQARLVAQRDALKKRRKTMTEGTEQYGQTTDQIRQLNMQIAQGNINTEYAQSANQLGVRDRVGRASNDVARIGALIEDAKKRGAGEAELAELESQYAQANDSLYQARIDVGRARARSKIDPRDVLGGINQDIKEAEDDLIVARKTGDKGLRYDAEQRKAQGKLRQQQEKAAIANARDSAGLAGAGSVANAAAQLRAAQRQLEIYEGTTGQDYWNALRAYRDAQLALAQAEQERADTQRRLASDITDPVEQARLDLVAAQQRRKLAPDQQTRESADLDVKRAAASEERAAFDQQMSDARINEQLGRTSHAAYMSYLQSEHNRLSAIANRTRQQQDMLNEVDLAMKETADQLSGQFNIGDIQIPTIYEVRRAIAEKGGRGGGGGDVVNNNQSITINGADMARVIQYINGVMGKPATVTRALQPRK